ncbi:hypothetical protein [Nocardia aurantia]|uniref:hypothetical protein n=1 Tax=Nocardia aurantia TaxID=2585199 RepID=UPI0012960EC6|nr:hypothetical protein [Nocardia aurantia]
MSQGRSGAGRARVPWWRIGAGAAAALALVAVVLLVTLRSPLAVAPSPDDRPIVPLPAVTSLLPPSPVAGIPTGRPQPW